MKRKTPIILIFLLAVLLLGVGCFFLFYQSKPKVVDETNKSTQIENKENSSGDKENEAVFNQNVHIYLGNDAKFVNNQIGKVEAEGSLLKISFLQNADCELATLGIGEIFFLEGGTNSPLEDTYIGKIADSKIVNEEPVILVETPMIDEVFDSFYLDEEFALTSNNIRSISTVEGVKVTPVNAIGADFFLTSSEDERSKATNLLWSNNQKIELLDNQKINLPSFMFELDVDIVKLVNSISDKKLAHDNSQNESIASADKSLKLKGRIGIEDLMYSYKADWDKKNYGIRDLEVGVTGKQIASVGIELLFSGEISAAKTEEKLSNFVKLQGLKEKLLPIVYVDCTTTTPVKITGKPTSLNDKIKSYTEFLPISCGFMIYMDIYGNLSLKASLNYNYSNEFEHKVVFVKDNQAVFKIEGASNPKKYFVFEASTNIDADAHLGISVMVYFFNVNLADVGITKCGFEMEGNGTLRFSSNTEENQGVYGSLYSRLYCKIGHARANLKAKINLWDIVDFQGDIDFEALYKDETWAESGQKKDTHYNSNTMDWGKMTAEDEDSFYYKSLEGKLIRERKNGISRVAIYEGDFFQICGIDKSFIYVLQPTEDDEVYDVRRIHKDGTISKIILEDVKYILLMKDNLMYYVPDSSKNTIYTLDRSTLKKKKLVKFDENVFYLSEQSSGFYVATEESDVFSWLFGASLIYYQIATDGAILQRYEELTPPYYVKEELDDYIMASKLISNGYLRETAEEVCWMDKNQGSYVIAEGISGWCPSQSGIFTTQENDTGKYIVLYQAANGSPKVVTEVNSDNAFFTLLQSENGDWYFMDQTETDLLLYRMDEQFQTKTLLETISMDTIPCDLESCGMEIRDNRLFFYNMTSWSESKVLYRYNLF